MTLSVFCLFGCAFCCIAQTILLIKTNYPQIKKVQKDTVEYLITVLFEVYNSKVKTNREEGIDFRADAVNVSNMLLTPYGERIVLEINDEDQTIKDFAFKKIKEEE